MEERGNIGLEKLGLIACGLMVVINLGIAAVAMVGAFIGDPPDHGPPAATARAPDQNFVVPEAVNADAGESIPMIEGSAEAGR